MTIEEIQEKFEKGVVSIKRKKMYSAREFSYLLGYKKNEWSRFEKVIENSIKSLELSNISVSDHIHTCVNMIEQGKGAKKPTPDYMLSRYACWIVAQNASSLRPMVSFFQNYLASVAEEREKLTKEDRERIALRSDTKKVNKALNAQALKSGLRKGNHSIFNNASQKILYSGLTVDETCQLKGVHKDDRWDCMGEIELTLNKLNNLICERTLKEKGRIGNDNTIKVRKEVARNIKATADRANIDLLKEPVKENIKNLGKKKKIEGLVS